MSKEKLPQKEEEKNNEEENVITINLKMIIILIAIVMIITAVFFYLYVKKNPNNENQSDSILGMPKSTEFSEENGIELLKAYLAVRSSIISNPQSVLESYGFATNQQFASYDKTADGAFIRTDILYEDIRNKLQDYITKDLFAKEFKSIYKPSNGITHVSTDNQIKEVYEVTRYEKIESSTRPTLHVWYKAVAEGGTQEEKSMIVEFSQYNGKWIISNIK